MFQTVQEREERGSEAGVTEWRMPGGRESVIRQAVTIYCTLLYCTVLYSAVLYCTLLCCILYCTLLCSAVLYCTVQADSEFLLPRRALDHRQKPLRWDHQQYAGSVHCVAAPATAGRTPGWGSYCSSTRPTPGPDPTPPSCSSKPRRTWYISTM